MIEPNPDEAPLFLALDPTQACRPGEGGVLRWCVTNLGISPLSDLVIDAELDSPDRTWVGQPARVARLEPNRPKVKVQGFVAPDRPGSYRLVVDLDCRDAVGRHLGYRSRDDLVLRFRAPEQPGGSLEIETGEVSLINLKHLLDQGHDVRVKTGDNSLVRWLEEPQAGGGSRAEGMVVQQMKELLAVPLEPCTATDPRFVPEMDAATPHAGLLNWLRGAGGGGAVRIRKRELATRDFAGVAASGGVQSLRMGQSLAFELELARPGYLTVLNVGTSGHAWLMVPNTGCSPQQARVSAGSHRIPGGDLLSAEWDIRENGPPGWEHLAVLLCDTPVVDGEILSGATQEGPFYRLNPHGADELLRGLRKVCPEADLVSFRVIQ